MRNQVSEIINLYQDEFRILFESIIYEQDLCECKLNFELFKQICYKIMKKYKTLEYIDFINKHSAFFDFDELLQCLGQANVCLYELKKIKFKNNIVLIKFHLSDLLKTLKNMLT